MKYFSHRNLLIFSLLFPFLLSGHPRGEKIAHGDVVFNRDSNVLTITQQTDKAIIHWNDFSIAKGEMTKFIQPAKTAAILNRVIEKNPSNILGSLQANGNVFLINPNGIFIGPEGKIKTAGFLASTLNTSDEDFLSGKNLRFTSDNNALIKHEGSIESEGTIFFISRKIEERGKTQANNIHLLAGEEILLIKEGENTAVKLSGQGSIDQKGLIEAAKIHLQSNGGDVFSLAINQEGILRSQGILEKDGEIILTADSGIIKVLGDLSSKNEKTGGSIHVLGEYVQLLDNAKIDVSSDAHAGTILLGGDYKGENKNIKNARALYVGEDVQINASSYQEGNGGKVILWADELNYFYGNILAKGGSQKGDGGFVEVSSHGVFEPNGNVDTSAENGKMGTLLFDPVNLNILNNGGVNSGLSPDIPPPPPAQADPYYITFSGLISPSIIDNTNLQNALAVNNIIIDVFGAGAGTGAVTISAPIVWSAPTCLTIITPESITVTNTANIQNTYPLGPTFNAIDFKANTAVATPGNFRGIYINGALISTVNGHIRLEGGGGNNAANNQGIAIDNAGKVISKNGNIIMIGSGQIPSEYQGILLDNGAIIETTGNGNIQLTGYSGGTSSGDFYTAGIVLDNAAQINSTATNGGSITLTGTGAPVGDDLITGVEFFHGEINSVDGNITVVGTGGGKGAPGDEYCIGIGAHWWSGPHNRITATGDAAITLIGKSGTGGSNQMGMYLEHDGLEISSNRGDITVYGESLGQFNNQNQGILTEGAGYIRSETGTITITGIGGKGGYKCRGIEHDTGFDIFTKDGPIIVTGIGGEGTTSSADGYFNGGSNCNFYSTGKGSISIYGYAGKTGTDGTGIAGGPGQIYSSGSGAIYLYGEGAGSSGGLGVAYGSGSTISATNDASITIIGKGSPLGSTSSQGVRFTQMAGGIHSERAPINIIGYAGGSSSDGISITQTTIYSLYSSASINLTGVATGSAVGIRTGLSGRIGNANTIAPITLTTDKIVIAATNPTIRTKGSSGSVTIQPYNINTAINLGDTGATLDLTSANFEQINTGDPGIIIGRSDGNHNIQVQNLSPAAINFPVLTLRGGSITYNDTIDLFGIPLTAYIGQAGDGYFALNNTATLNASPLTVTGMGEASGNAFYGSNTVNDWNITNNNDGIFSPSSGFVVTFTNIGSLIGGNQGDTFTFPNQKRLAGLVDGTAPAQGNFLVYSDWFPLPLVVFNTLNDGWASNLDGGFFNIENAYGIAFNPYQLIKAAKTQLSLGYLYLNPSKEDDLYTNLQSYLRRNYIEEKNIFWVDINASVVFNPIFHKLNLDSLDFEIIQPNFKKYSPLMNRQFYFLP